MLQTIEAIYHPQDGLIFSEKINITTPMKVFVTFVEKTPFSAAQKGSAQALFDSLEAHPLPLSTKKSNTEIETQITEISQSWDI